MRFRGARASAVPCTGPRTPVGSRCGPCRTAATSAASRPAAFPLPEAQLQVAEEPGLGRVDAEPPGERLAVRSRARRGGGPGLEALLERPGAVLRVRDQLREVTPQALQRRAALLQRGLAVASAPMEEPAERRDCGDVEG